MKTKIKNVLSANQWSHKIKFNINTLNKVLLAIVIVCSVAYVASINDLIVKGFKLQELKNQSYTLQEENRQARIKSTSLESYKVLSQKAGEMDMVAVGEEIAYVNITPSVQLVVAPGGKIEIGDNVEIGSFSHFSAGTYSMEKNDMLPSAQGRVSRGIILKDSVMIGAGVIILDGVTIGKSSIIGAGSVVTESIPERSVAFGIPARVMKERGGKREDTVRDR